MRIVKYPLMVLCLMASTPFAYAQISFGSHSNALANIQALPEDHWWVLNNPASSPDRSPHELTLLSGSKAAFIPMGLYHHMAGAGYALKQFNLGLAIERWGDHLLADQSINLNANWKPKNTCIGIRAKLIQRTFPQQAFFTFSIDAGVKLQLAQHLWWSTVLKNISFSQLGSERPEKIPSSISSNISYHFHDYLRVIAELSLSDLAPSTQSIAIEYIWNQRLSFRIGTQIPSQMLTAGTLVKVGQYEIGYAYQHHHFQVDSHMLDIVIPIKKSKLVF